MPAFREIVLHAGLSKTGTTSIQDTCARQREALADGGVIYPVFSMDAHTFHNHSIPLTAAFCKRPGRFRLGLGQRFGPRAAEVGPRCRAQLDAWFSESRSANLLLSTELLEVWTDEDLQNLRAYLTPHAGRLRVLAVVRSPADALASLVQERAKAGVSISPSRMVGRVSDKVQRLRRNFGGELELYDFHRLSVSRRGLVGEFLAVAGARPAIAHAAETGHRNRRLSLEAFHLLDALNRRYPSLMRPGHGHSPSTGLDQLQQLPGQPFYLEGFEGSGLERAILAETEWLEAELGWRFPRQPSPAPGSPWQPETITALMRVVDSVTEPSARVALAQCLLDESECLAAGDPAAGDPAAGDPAAGDPAAGDLATVRQLRRIAASLENHPQ